MSSSWAVSLFAGAGAKLGEIVSKKLGARLSQAAVDTLHRRFGTLPTPARNAAEKNAAMFLDLMVTRLANEEAERGRPGFAAQQLEHATDEPATAEALLRAVAIAGRTSAADRHEVLAHLVADRLGAAGDSAKAVAGNLAIEVVEKLGAEHLHILGLLALVHAGFSQKEFRASADLREQESLGNATGRPGKFLSDQFRLALETLGVPPELSSGSLVHLQSVGCILLGAKSEQDIERVITGERTVNWSDRLVGTGANLERRALRGVLRLGGRPSLEELWRGTLSSVALTPTGLVVGLAVLDQRLGGRRLDAWEWSASSSAIVFEVPNQLSEAMANGELERWVLKKIDDRAWRERTHRGDARL